MEDPDPTMFEKPVATKGKYLPQSKNIAASCTSEAPNKIINSAKPVAKDLDLVAVDSAKANTV